MSGAPRVRSMNVADSETRPILGPTGNNKAGGGGGLSGRKPSSKPLAMSKVEKSPEEKKQTSSPMNNCNSSSRSPKPHSLSAASVLRRHEQLLHSNLSMNASCSSDASTDSFHSRASTGRLIRSYSTGSRRKAVVSRPRSVASDSGIESPPTSPGGSPLRKTCAWVTPNTDPGYAAFHDEEWGVPVHDDKKLFELLVLSGALAELTWPAILSKRHIFREVFADFDPITVSKFNEKKLVASGSKATPLLSEPKLRAIIENARQISKVVDEFGSFDKYIWSFVNYKPIVSRFRYPRQVPAKTPKADAISKDLVRRGFRSVGPTVVYSFMQAAGITNDHILSCFRFQECINAAEGKEESNGIITASASAEGREHEQEQQKQQDVLKIEDCIVGSEMSMAMDELNLCSE